MKKDKQRLSELRKMGERRCGGSPGKELMNKSLLIYWKDKSGISHRFWIYPLGTKFNEPCPGIYIYAKETSPHKWIPVYIRQTENVNVGLTNHEQQECVDQNGATHIHVSIITDEKSRFTIEKDLIEQWKPVCNTQFGLIAQEVALTNPDVVVRDENGKAHTVRYETATATLLSELLKEHRKLQEQDATIAQLKKDLQATIARQQKQIEALNEDLQKVRGQLEAKKPAPQRSIISWAPSAHGNLLQRYCHSNFNSLTDRANSEIYRQAR